MQKIFFTVGPSQIYPTVPKHITNSIKQNILSVSHRGQEFKDLYQETDQNLKKLLKIPENFSILFVSSALEAMERSILGLVEKSSFHIVTGSFGNSWHKIATQLNKKAEKIEILNNLNNPLSKIKIPKETELICITQNDTSTGVFIPISEINSLKLHFPKKLIAIDVVSSIPYVDIDFSKIDLTFFSVQKGFGLPAGLGIMIVSPNALEKASKILQNGISIGSYHSLVNLFEKYQDFQTPETPNVLNIYLLNEVLKDMLKSGIEKIRKDTDIKSEIFYKFFENHPEFEPFVKEKSYRSPTTLVIDVRGKSKALRDKLAKKGFIIATGYGPYKDAHVRIANFPVHKLAQVKDLIESMKFFLKRAEA